MKKLFRILSITLVILLLASVVGCRRNNNGQNADPTEQTASNTETTVNTNTPQATDSGASAQPTELQPDITPDASLLPSDAPSADPSATPAASTAGPSSGPTPTPSSVDTVLTGAVWFDGSRTFRYDMDMDGIPEKVELTASGSSGASVKITVGSNDKVLSGNISGSFASALINDFNSGDGRAELVISTTSGQRARSMLCIRLDAASTALSKITVDGKAESIEGNTIIVSRMLDLLGTWECTAPFSFSDTDFSLDMEGEDWTVKPVSGRMCTVSEELLIGYYTSGLDNETGFIEPGYQMYPTKTDMRSYIDVTLDTGALCYLPVTLGSNGELLYSGRPLTEWFSDLTFIN